MLRDLFSPKEGSSGSNSGWVQLIIRVLNDVIWDSMEIVIWEWFR